MISKFLKLFAALLLVSMSSCNHNKAAWLYIAGQVVDGTGVPIEGVEVEYPLLVHCDSPNLVNPSRGECKFITDNSGRWSSKSQVCSTDVCSSSLTARKTGYTDTTQTFEYDGTKTTDQAIQVILVP